MGELAAWGQSAAHAFDRAAFRLLLSGTPFRSDNTAIPWVDYDDDGRQLRRPRLHLHRRAGGRGLPADHLPGLRRRDGMGLRRQEPHGRVRDAAAAPGVGPPAADGAGRRRRLDRPGAARRRRAPGGGARRRPPQGRRAGGGGRQGARERAGRPAVADHGPAAAGGHLRRPGRVRRHRPLRFVGRALAGVGADGQRGRGHPAPARGRVRHAGPHRAVLPPGGGPVRTPHAPAAAPDELPADARRPRPQAAGRRRWRRSAATRWSWTRRWRSATSRSSAPRPATASRRCPRTPTSRT